MSDLLSKPTLPTFSWIGHLKPDDRELLSSYGEFFPGHPGATIIEEGAVQTEVLVVISGKLEVRAKQEDGSELVLAQVGPGETLGEISLFVPGPAAATVTAVEFSQLWRIADADLMEFMQENPGAGNVLLRTLASILAQRLRQMNPRAFGLSTYAVVETPELKEQAPDVEVETTPTTTTSLAQPVDDLTTKPDAPKSETPKFNPPIPPAGLSEAYKVKRVSTKTQIVPDLDELEPL